jgi:photosystem II stability/assembly factor-like uncharacterized protein
MKNKKTIFRAFSLLILAFFVSGCTILPTSSSKKKATTPAAYQGGVFRTADFSVQANTLNWQKVADVYATGGKVRTLDTASIVSYALDPNDSAALYIGSQNEGIYYTYNYGQAWLQTLADKGAVNAIAVSPDPAANKCTIYAAANNYIYLSKDCGRTWGPVYFEARTKIIVTALAIRKDNPKIIYAGTSEGNFIRSFDGGVTWDSIYRFNNNIINIIIQNHVDSKIIYVVTQSAGIWRSPDGAENPGNWVDLMTTQVDQSEVADEGNFKEFGKISGSKSYLAISADKSVGDGLIYVNTIGIYRLKFGDMWRQLKLIPPKKKETITAVGVNPDNTNEVLYASTGAFYRTFDAGVNWNITPLPNSGKPAWAVFSDDSKFFYLANYYYPPKK